MNRIWYGIIALFGIICILAIIYSMIAAIWGFNPTEIINFNGKLAFTAVIGFIICGILINTD